MQECPFCKLVNKKEKYFYEDDYVIAFLDAHPVTNGHTLIIPKRHIPTPEKLNEDEWKSVFYAFKQVKKLLDLELNPDGYNFGANIGKYGGQTVMHVHFHLIPRYKGDAGIYEGGIRNIIPHKGPYRKLKLPPADISELTRRLKDLKKK